MNCREVRNLLVAFQDGELSPGEATRVAEHLESCSSCRRLEERLAAATPRPFLQVSPEFEDNLRARLDEAVQAAFDLPVARERRPWWRSAARWLGEDVRVPNGAALAWAAAFLLVLSWGISNWQAARTTSAIATSRVATSWETEIPASQFRQAAYVPEPSHYSANPRDTEETDW